MTTSKFELTAPEKRKIADLKKSRLTELFEDFKIESYYLKLQQDFKEVRLPIVIDESNMVHGGWNQLVHLEKAGTSEVDVVVVKGVKTEVDAARLTDFSMFFTNRNYSDLAASQEYLTKLLTESDEGKKWAKEIPGKHTRDKISYLTDTSTGKLGIIKCIHDYAPESFNDIKDNKQTLKGAYDESQAKNPKSRKEKPGMVASKLPLKPVSSVLIKYVDGEEYDINVQNGLAKIISFDKSEYESEAMVSAKPHQSGDLDDNFDVKVSEFKQLSITLTTIHKAA